MNEKELNKEIQEITEENQESDNQKIDFYESREDLANIIHNIIEHPQAYKINNLENESVIISINGEWGSGKTTFLNEEIIAKIKNNKSIKYINFNAWEYDASNNALLSLFLEILKKIKDSKTKKSLEKIRESLGKILKAIKINFGFSFFNAEINFEKLFENSENNTLSDEIREMKKELNDLIENKEKLLIIIDELDRCKPPFAIELIEVIKHLLSNKNIIIILALNWKQLHKALENTYGLINDPKEEYLDKVVDWKFDLNDLNDKEKIIRSIAEKNGDFMKQESSDELIKWIASQYNSKEDTIRTFQNNFKKYLFHWIQRFQKTKKPNMILYVEKIVFLCIKNGITSINKNNFVKEISPNPNVISFGFKNKKILKILISDIVKIFPYEDVIQNSYFKDWLTKSGYENIHNQMELNKEQGNLSLAKKLFIFIKFNELFYWESFFKKITKRLVFFENNYLVKKEKFRILNFLDEIKWNEKTDFLKIEISNAPKETHNFLFKNNYGHITFNYASQYSIPWKEEFNSLYDDFQYFEEFDFFKYKSEIFLDLIEKINLIIQNK